MKRNISVFIFILLGAFFTFFGINKVEAADDNVCKYSKTANYEVKKNGTVVTKLDATITTEVTLGTSSLKINSDKLGINDEKTDLASGKVNSCLSYVNLICNIHTDWWVWVTDTLSFVFQNGQYGYNVYCSASSVDSTEKLTNAYNYAKTSMGKLAITSSILDSPFTSPRELYVTTDNHDSFFIEYLPLISGLTDAALQKIDDEMLVLAGQIQTSLDEYSSATSSGKEAAATKAQNLIDTGQTQLAYAESVGFRADVLDVIPNPDGYDALSLIAVDSALAAAKAGNYTEIKTQVDAYQLILDQYTNIAKGAGCYGVNKNTDQCKALLQKIEETTKNFMSTAASKGWTESTYFKELLIALDTNNPLLDLNLSATYPLKCSDFYDSESGTNLLNEILNILKIFAPIAVILLGTADFVKAVAASDQDALKKAGSNFAKRVVAAVILFLIPSIIQIVFTMASDSGMFDDLISTPVITCE